MKFSFFLAGVIIALTPSLAHADDKADTILKEARLRMKNATTYSTTLTFVEGNKLLGTNRFGLQRPDKFFLELTEITNPPTKPTRLVINGNSVMMRQGDQSVPVPVSQARQMINTFLLLVSGDFGRIFTGGMQGTRYVTQKMLDEKVRVDVIDVMGSKPEDNVRVYVDNNSLIRKIAGRFEGKGAVITFLNPVADEPLLPSTFLIK